MDAIDVSVVPCSMIASARNAGFHSTQYIRGVAFPLRNFLTTITGAHKIKDNAIGLVQTKITMEIYR